MKAERRGHDADAQAKVAGTADGNRMFGKTGARSWSKQFTRVGRGRKQAVLLGELFSEHQHFVDAPSGLDRAGHRQGVIGLDEHSSNMGCAGDKGGFR